VNIAQYTLHYFIFVTTIKLVIFRCDVEEIGFQFVCFQYHKEVANCFANVVSAFQISCSNINCPD